MLKSRWYKAWKKFGWRKCGRSNRNYKIKVFLTNFRIGFSQIKPENLSTWTIVEVEASACWFHSIIISDDQHQRHPITVEIESHLFDSSLPSEHVLCKVDMEAGNWSETASWTLWLDHRYFLPSLTACSNISQRHKLCQACNESDNVFEVDYEVYCYELVQYNLLDSITAHFPNGNNIV